MGVTDMGGADGMVFLFFDAVDVGVLDARHPDAAEHRLLRRRRWLRVGDGHGAMPRGPAGRDCPRYRADGPYTSAIEVPQGRLAELLIGPGSRFELLDVPCEPDVTGADT